MKDFMYLLTIGITGFAIGAGVMNYYDTKELQDLVDQARKTADHATKMIEAIKQGQRAFCGTGV